MQFVVTNRSVDESIALGRKIGSRLKGGEVIELTSDLGGGKTSFTRGIAEGFKTLTPASSPSFTISNIYQRADGKNINHFDFYRLSEPGIIRDELAEVLGQDREVVIIEWADSVADILPAKRIIIEIKTTSENGRQLRITYPKEFAYLLG